MTLNDKLTGGRMTRRDMLTAIRTAAIAGAAASTVAGCSAFDEPRQWPTVNINPRTPFELAHNLPKYYQLLDTIEFNPETGIINDNVSLYNGGLKAYIYGVQPDDSNLTMILNGASNRLEGRWEGNIEGDLWRASWVDPNNRELVTTYVLGHSVLVYKNKKITGELALGWRKAEGRINADFVENMKPGVTEQFVIDTYNQFKRWDTLYKDVSTVMHERITGKS